MTNKEYWFWLYNLEGIGIRKINALIDYYEDPMNIYNAKVIELEQIKNLCKKDRETLLNKRNKDAIKADIDKVYNKGIKFITRDDKEYPIRLRNIYDSPIGLFVKGTLPDDKVATIGIVGARNCSNYGKEMAIYFAKELSKHGIQVISGLAHGIDSFAHKGTLIQGGKTFGILGSGIDICYPEQNIDVYMEMQKNGGVISEYGLGVRPKPGNFPMRNRIISGLSDGILVIEAKEKSGSLITADIGLEQGKNIYSLPGKLTDELSKGCNNLIKMGAEMVTEPGEILKDYTIENKINTSTRKENNNSLERKQNMVYAYLSFEPKHIEDVIKDTQLELKEVIEILLELELSDYIKQITKNYYVILP